MSGDDETVTREEWLEVDAYHARRDEPTGKRIWRGDALRTRLSGDKVKLPTPTQPLVCALCGAEYEARRGDYCPPCRVVANRDATRERMARMRARTKLRAELEPVAVDAVIAEVWPFVQLDDSARHLWHALTRAERSRIMRVNHRLVPYHES